MNRLVLFLAQGFFLGRIPFAPGSFGSILGLLWVAVLLSSQNGWCYSAGGLLGILGSVWLCGKAEKILGETDPSSVVVDEVAAMPLCFASWLALCIRRNGELPGPQAILTGDTVWWTAGIFLAFRFFDIVKPWPVRQSQVLPGGWGVTVDDVLAALYVNLALIVVWVTRAWANH